ncbi:MAG: YCF48-related protein [Candidatus Kapabacteria bacterium]|nr:YCF48-related protein [Candidatus Kapabacteria bacterium]
MKKLLLFMLVGIFLSSIVSAQYEWYPQLNIPSGVQFNKVHFYNYQNGWAVANQRIFHTTDGGLNWNINFQTIMDVNYNDFIFLDSNHGWVLEEWNLMLKTNDGGQNWNINYHPTVSPFTSIQFLDSLNGWLCGWDGIQYTNNGGFNWEQKDISLSHWNRIFFINSSNGWVVGDSCKVMHTSDGGQTWISQNSAADNWLNSVYFSDPFHGCAVGNGEKIICTTNGGVNWSVSAPTLTSKILYDVMFLDSLKGWACGDSGLIIHTSDGGLNWQQESSNFNSKLLSIHFLDSVNGWVSGLNSILHTRPMEVGINSVKNRNDYQYLFCYSNPFTNLTTINYSLGNSGNVSLRIFNVFGGELDKLINSYQVIGDYKFDFNSDNLGSGVYYILLQVDGLITTGKMMVIK